MRNRLGGHTDINFFPDGASLANDVLRFTARGHRSRVRWHHTRMSTFLSMMDTLWSRTLRLSLLPMCQHVFWYTRIGNLNAYSCFSFACGLFYSYGDGNLASPGGRHLLTRRGQHKRGECNWPNSHPTTICPCSSAKPCCFAASLPCAVSCMNI